MIKKRNFWIVVIVGLIALMLISESYRYNLNQLTNKLVNLSKDFDGLHEDYLNNVARYTYTIPENLTAISEDDKLVSIQDFSTKIYFVIRIQETNCEDCIIQQNKLIKKLAAKIGASNILIFGQYSSLKNLSLTKKRIAMPYRAFNIDTISFINNSNIDRENVPYFFILYQGKIKYLYFPDKNLSEKYLEVYYNRVADVILADKKGTP